MSEEQKIIDLENEISFLKDALCEKQNEIEEKTTILLAGAEKVKHLEKEIEKLNFENHMVKKWNEQLDKNSISKDKIREKIKEIHNKGTFDAEIVLTKLLEEN